MLDPTAMPHAPRRDPEEEARLARSLVWRLGGAAEGEPLDVALLLEGDTVWFARHRPGAARAPSSSIVRLVQGIWERQPAQARRIVRRRIYSTAVPTEMCLGMVKVAALRLTAPVEPSPPSPLEATNLRLLDVGDFANPWNCGELPGGTPDCMQLAERLAQSIAREGPRHACDRPVAAVLASAEGRVLFHALNTNARNRTLHAEVNLLQGWHRRSGRGIPPGARIYTTLKPCKMCAAMIWHLAEDRASLKVFYRQDDPGPNGARTVLDRATHERLRAARDPAERALEILEHLEG